MHMSAVMSKRHQARNEKILRDLVQGVPGNNRCADCQMPSPAWASWSLGVFLCMRCAAIHRKLGTHISKVKSLSMDSWTNEQVDNMRKVGNVVSNQIYNPGNKRPPVPIDADEADSAMERFIRQKYCNNVASDLGRPRSPRSNEGTPPPLPPKNSTKFGFRSASSIFPLSSRAKRGAKMAAVMSAAPAPAANKPSKVFGATVHLDGPDDFDTKLARMQDMGFLDSQRNAMVLKGVNGSLERAVEALIRLGEGASSPAPPPRDHSLRASRSLTPLTLEPTNSTCGLTVPRNEATAERPATAISTPMSTNPFDVPPPAPAQTAQSTGNLLHVKQHGVMGDGQTNPFWHTPQQVDAVGRAFRGLTLSPPQTLFPHHTGEVAALGHQHYVSPSAPSAPSSPLYYQPLSLRDGMTYSQAQVGLAPGPGNPFLAQGGSPIRCQSPGPMMGGYGNNPFARSPTRIASPGLVQIPEQGQTSFLVASPPTNTNNPFFVNGPQPCVGIVPDQQQQQSWNQPRRHDKASIMALYNQPAPQAPAATPAPAENRTACDGLTDAPRSASQPPLPGCTNPFLAKTTPEPLRQMSRDSMALGMDMAWTSNGRHSPDAFASLSARHA
ncbi:hypothetical protein L249_1485 [Ophiocordyceps polyrhachis-furcata BCC 54312]|uniref:Arf-GAP domain-containing protein n=1 Tax=Ophiocordyceps polyrhachis-furcata BCC 54312 TaxID=1330021 RepID=A0A367L428_9HYPO|nr:hypothetical protein L249_1485 [Ophiocordyceps polyrhachis-furcata BCC 54312]